MERDISGRTGFSALNESADVFFGCGDRQIASRSENKAFAAMGAGMESVTDCLIDLLGISLTENTDSIDISGDDSRVAEKITGI